MDDIHYAVKRITLPRWERERKKVLREVKLHAKMAVSYTHLTLPTNREV